MTPGPQGPLQLRPPATEIGVLGWLRKNLFSSFGNILLTFLGCYLLYKTIPPFLNWAILDAAWFGNGREACITPPGAEKLGACWVFIKVRLGMFMYGFYPEAERWRIQFTLMLMFFGALPVLWQEIRQMPAAWRQRAAALNALGGALLLAALFGIGPGLAAGGLLAAPFLLSRLAREAIRRGAASGHPVRAQWFCAGLPMVTGAAACLVAQTLWGPETAQPLFWAGLVAGLLLLLLNTTAIAVWSLGTLMTLYPVAAYVLFLGGGFGLARVETDLWGGMFLTLVVAGVGIAASLPIGILLALGRRSRLPVIKTLCVCFIEFIRGVPLISVLFMASVMLPLFLPDGVHFNKLLRALIGVALFYAAYMAEVVRGGLQAIGKDQFEAADAIGLTYWQTMRLVILPQALRTVIPGITNTFIGLFKDTTLVAVIGLLDMLGIVKTALADTDWLGFSKEAYVFAALSFWVFCFAISRYSTFLEKKLRLQK